MTSKTLKTFAICFLLLYKSTNAINVDSLKTDLNRSTNDSTTCHLLYLLSLNASDEEWPKFNERMYKLASEKVNATTSPSLRRYYHKFLGEAENNFGFLNENEGRVNEALTHYLESIKLYRIAEEKFLESSALRNAGSMYYKLGYIEKGLGLYHASLKIREGFGESSELANIYSDVGVIYEKQSDITRALEFYTKALNMYKKLKNRAGEAWSLNNIGLINYRYNKPEKSVTIFEEALKIQKEINDVKGQSRTINNLGGVYYSNKQYKEALEWFQKSYDLKKEVNDIYGLNNSLQNIAQIYLETGRINEAQKTGLALYNSAQKLTFPEQIKNAAKLLSSVYEKQNKGMEALKMYRTYVELRDSLQNLSAQKATMQAAVKFEYEKKAAADSVEHANERKIKNAQLNKQKAEIKVKKNQQTAMFIGLLLVLIFTGIIYNRLLVIKKQKLIIETKEKETLHQKSLIEEKQKEILDSIVYAKRIQLAQIPSEKRVYKEIERLKNKNSY